MAKFSSSPIYPEAPESLIEHWQKRRAPIVFGTGEGLVALDIDLTALRAPAAPLEEPPSDASRARHKAYEQSLSLIGQSGLAHLNAELIGHLRKRDFPAHAPALFHRLWREEGRFLREELDHRWLISSLITFGDHGEEESQRSLGREMGMLFSMMKLYEFERQFSGTPADQPHVGGQRLKGRLTLDMPLFSLRDGGLDINLLAPLWQRAAHVPLAGPIALQLLEALNYEPASIFARLQKMRQRRQAGKGQSKGFDKEPQRERQRRAPHHERQRHAPPLTLAVAPEPETATE